MFTLFILYGPLGFPFDFMYSAICASSQIKPMTLTSSELESKHSFPVIALAGMYTVLADIGL